MKTYLYFPQKSTSLSNKFYNFLVSNAIRIAFFYSMLLFVTINSNAQCLSFGSNGPFNIDDTPVTLVTIPPVSDPNITGENFSGLGITDTLTGLFDPSAITGGGPSVITLTAFDAGTGCPANPALNAPVTVCNLQVSCKDATAVLGSDCTVTITPNMIDNGSSDNICGIPTRTVSPNIFGLADSGVQTVTLTVTNGSGIIRTCTSEVTIVPPPCPGGEDFNMTIAGAPSTPGSPQIFCTTDGLQALAIAATNNQGDPICIATGTFTSNSMGIIDAGDNTATFNPLLAGPGLHILSYDYICPGSGQMTGTSLSVNVVATPTAELVPTFTLECGAASGVLYLSNLFEMGSSQTGTWTLESGPAGASSVIDGARYEYIMDGCYSFRFLADDPNNCLPDDITDVSDVHIQTKPDFDFSLSNQGGCLGSGTIDVSANITPALPSGQLMSGTVQVGEAAPVAWDPNTAYTVNAPASNATEDYILCVTREKSGNATCGGGLGVVPNGPCPVTVCQSFSVYNDGLNCQSNCEMNDVDVCGISVDPQLTLACSFFSISVPIDLVGAEITPKSQLIGCDDEEVFIDYNFEFGGFNPESGGGGATIGSLPGISIICDVFNFCICIDLGFLGDISFRPFESLYDALKCDETIAQVILTLLSELLGGDGGGAMVVADTDGDGAFDYEIEDGSSLSGTNVSVPVNIDGQGELTIRMVSGWPNKPAGVCGTATVPGQDLLTLLPIGAIPIVGPTIVSILEAASCNVDLSWSNEETVVYPVINGNAPIFVNCPSEGYTFSQDFSCDTEANWSIPVAVDGCTGEVIPFTTDTGTTEGLRKVSGPDPGDDLAIGIYSAIYEATSCNGMTTQCIIPIIIDAGDPQLIASDNFVVCTDIDECEATVLGLAPLRGIGCNTVISYYTTGATVVGSMAAPIIGEASGVDFNLGLTTVNYIMTWLDAQGMTQTATDDFTVTVEDCQFPVAECHSVTAQLDNEGNVVVTAAMVDALSSDNCTSTATLDIQISKSSGIFSPEVSFNCDELGINFVTLRAIDEAGNASFCLAQVEIIDYFEDFILTMDLPELCLEANNPEQFDFTNYLNVTQPNGTIISAADVMGVLGGNVVGLFGITSFIPSSNTSGVAIGTSSADPQDIGYIDAFTGVYTPGTGSGFVTISYILTLGGNASQGNNALDGCYKVVHETFELKQPLEMGSPMCECLGVNSRQVDLGIVTGGLEPYRIEYVGGTLDYNEDGFEDDIDGIYTYDLVNGYDITDGMEDLGLMWLNYTSPVWSITIVDARGCEIARSGSCDIIDETEGPEIDCRGTNDFDTEVFICERQYAWLHAIPTDNCAVTQYSYTITNPDGTIAGPFTLDALIDDANTGVPLEELQNAEYEFEAGSSTITYYAEDAVGNFTTCSFVVVVEDNDPPYFINCPYPDVVIATETDQCDAFVNFALPLAEDNCVMPTVTQIDDLGLTTGDRFPIGTTILTFQAMDGVGNKTICKVKVTVNHFDHVPTIACPGDMTQSNDDWLCGAEVNNISAFVEELCADELVKTYQIVQNGEVVTTGLDDASGTYFEVGESEVTYRVQNQPLLLISEITQDADALIGGMNPPPIVNEFQCFSDTLFALGNGDVGEGLVYYPVDDLIYHFSGATDGNEYFEEIYFPGKCVQPNHLAADTHGPNAAGQITGMVWDPTTEKFIAMDIDGNIYTVSTTGDYLQISTFDQAVSLSGFTVDGASVYGVNGTNLYEFNPLTGFTTTTTVLMSSGEAIVSATDIATDPLSGDTYIIYTTGASATSYIGTLDLATGMITEQGDTFIDFGGITIDATGQVYGVSSKAAGSDLYTIKCAIPGDDYIEITNFGPSTYDVSCLNIARTLVNGDEEIYVVPNGIELAPGEVLVLHYGPGVDNQAGPSYFLNFCEGTDQPAGAILPYSIFFGNNQLDAVDMLADAQGGIIRTGLFDTDSPADFVLAEDCLSITLGEYNPIYPPALDNGTNASLQSEPKSVAECSFKVTVEDVEPPKCMEIDDMNLFVGPALNAVEGECNQSIISVPDGNECILTEINVSLIGDIVGSEFITISLISPQNDTLDLYDQLCVGDAAVDMTFDDESENLASAICGSWNGDFRPQTEMLMEFYTSKLAGDWTLFVNIEAGSGASFNLTSWSIESTCMMDWVMEDVELENDLGLCSAEYTWIHPYYVDNCTFGSISVDYFSDDDIDVPTGGLLVDNFRKGGFEVTEVFGVGTTTVQYTLEDLSGNESQCQFDIVVLDTEDPVITECPGNIFVALEGGECREVVNYVVEAEDNCEVVSIIGVPASGTYFEIGTTEVIVTVTDASGNTSLCVFDVIVVEFEPTSNAFACNNAINLSLDNNCEAVINADMILEGNNYRCYEDYCITITSETGVPHDNFFDVSDINQTFNVSVSDCSGDIQYSCWGTVTIEEKFDPEIGCPVDVTIFCNEDPEAIDSLTGLLLTGEAIILNCEPGAEITYEDNTIDFGQCSNPRMLITRTWIVIDADGNEAQCNQEITIAAVDYASIIFPEDLDLDTALECEDVSADESLLTPENTGYPTLNGQNITEAGSLCMISKNVSDEIYDICNGSYEILRTWKLRNMCEPLSVTNPLTHTQIIKVLDTSAPKFAVCPSDTIMSVAPLNCVGNGFLAIPQSINDLCGEVVFDANIYGGGALEISGTVADNNLSVFASNMRKGDHRVEYTAEDDCGNISECSFIVTVVDITPPVVVVKQNVIVNLSTNGDPDSGATKLFVGSVDQGSFDGCTAVRVEIRRESDNCGISGNTTFNADGHPTDGSPNPNAANYDSDDGQSVMFCCEDIPDGEVEAVVKVIVRVWDDGNDTGFFGDGVDLNGDGDTLDPGEYDNYNESWVDVTVEQKDVPSLACPSDITLACDMDYTDPNLRGTAISSSLCGSVMIDVTYTPQLNACGLGFVIATYSVASSPSVTCSQRITLENPYPTFAENSIKYPRDLPTSPTGQLSCQDDIPFDEPTWTAGPCDFIGYTEEVDTFFFELDPDTGLPVDECFNILRSFTVTDWCVYDATNGEGGTYFGSQTITITDNEAPVLLECEPTMYEVDADCVRTSTDLTNMAEDNGDCASDWLKWQVFVDTWADGVVDYEYSSFLANNTNFNTDSNNNGVVDKFLAPTMSGEQVSVTVSEVLEASSFNHIVTWKVTDGCGNVSSCETTFMVVDKKAPTPNCVNLSSAPMPSTNTLELWAIDYDLGASDNCTAQENLRFTFSNTSPENDPNYDPAQRSSAMTFTAPEDCGLQPIDVYVWDEAGNVDFCTVTLLLSGEGCPDSGNRVIAGTSVTEAGNGVSEAQVILEAEIAEYPLTQMTTEEGGFAFTENPDAIDYSLRIQKNDKHTNGVSTLDLVLIQRHVVGFQEFDSPYKVIASDISNDENVSAIDIVELRKVILGIQDEFSNNTSWRFIDATQQFSDILDPFPIDEERDIDNLSNEMLNEDFIAIKIGDVNASATFNVTGAIAEVRNRENLKFEYEDRFVKAGELVSITLNSTEFKDISGFQLTMEFDGLSYSGVESKSIDMAEYNVGQIKSDIITMSWTYSIMKTTATEELFIINLIAEESGYLSDMIKISDSIISTEIYQGAEYAIKGIELGVRSDRVLTEEIQLMQNDPNPFKDKTTIAFSLPTQSMITLSILDVTGKVLRVIEGEYEAGNNSITLFSNELGTSGLLYYTLKTEGFSETKKMILIN